MEEDGYGCVMEGRWKTFNILYQIRKSLGRWELLDRVRRIVGAEKWAKEYEVDDEWYTQ